MAEQRLIPLERAPPSGLHQHTPASLASPLRDALAEGVGATPFMRPGWIGAWLTAFGDGPLERLADGEQSLEDKNRWLAGWLREKLNQREVRFYEEPTVLFDE